MYLVRTDVSFSSSLARTWPKRMPLLPYTSSAFVPPAPRMTYPCWPPICKRSHRATRSCPGAQVVPLKSRLRQEKNAVCPSNQCAAVDESLPADGQMHSYGTAPFVGLNGFALYADAGSLESASSVASVSS